MAMKYPKPAAEPVTKTPETITVTGVGQFPTHPPRRKGITPAKETK